MRLSIFRSLLDRINLAAGSLSLGNILVFKVMMVSALVIVFARGIAPFEIGKDQSVQLEAAHRLVEGQGLTSTNFVSSPHDISEPPVAHNLTWWPPGFTLIVAALLLTGLPLFIVLKTIFMTVTLVGWLGWAVIASYFFARPITFRGRSISINLFLAALIPILFTPLWTSSDIFLWAGVPIVFLCLFKQQDSQSNSKYIAIGGVLFGILFGIRYASLFLGIAAVSILFQISYPSFKIFLRRMGIFVAASSLSILPTILYVKWLSQDKSVVPDIVSVGVLPNPKYLIIATLETSRAVSNLIFGVPLVEWLILGLGSRALTMLAGGIFLAICLGLPIFLAKSSPTPIRENLPLSLSILLQSLVVFLFLIAVGTRSIFFGQPRYYVPVSLSGIFIFYHLFVSPKTSQPIRIVAGCAILPLLAYICLFIPRQFTNANKFHYVVQHTLGYSLSKNSEYGSTSHDLTFPSFELYSFKENSRHKLAELKKDSPEAIFFVENYGYYIYDNFEGGPVPGKDLRRLPDKKSTFWSKAYTSKNVKVFWVIDPKTEYLIPTTQIKEIHFDPYEKTKIYVSEFRANSWFSNTSTARFR